MINDLKKSLVLVATMVAPLCVSAPAMANTLSNKVNPGAVTEFTASVKEALSAYDSLERGDIINAQSNLEQALNNIENALSKDPTLGLPQKSGKNFHNDLKRVKAATSSSDRFQAKTELGNVLSSAGIVINP